jgi:hypothetical protein
LTPSASSASTVIRLRWQNRSSSPRMSPLTLAIVRSSFHRSVQSRGVLGWSSRSRS